MKFARDVHEHYQKAYALATRSQKKHKKMGLTACPVSMDNVLDNKLVSYRLDLGVIEIPTSLIVGVAEATEKATLYTKDFLPVSIPKSQFAEQWGDIYNRHVNHESMGREIRCYEFLGRFYVSDGLKRVSVAKYHGTATVKSQVIRLMPIRTEEKKVEQYYEFLFQYRLTRLYQLQFTQSGYFEKLQAALKKEPTSRWTDGDRNSFLLHWTDIERAFHKSYDDNLNITAADALVVLLEKYPYEQIIQMEQWMLERVFQAFWKEFCTLSYPGFTLGGKKLQSEDTLQTA